MAEQEAGDAQEAAAHEGVGARVLAPDTRRVHPPLLPGGHLSGHQQDLCLLNWAPPWCWRLGVNCSVWGAGSPEPVSAGGGSNGEAVAGSPAGGRARGALAHTLLGVRGKEVRLQIMGLCVAFKNLSTYVLVFKWFILILSSPWGFVPRYLRVCLTWRSREEEAPAQAPHLP